MLDRIPAISKKNFGAKSMLQDSDIPIRERPPGSGQCSVGRNIDKRGYGILWPAHQNAPHLAPRGVELRCSVLFSAGDSAGFQTP
jgi:hypothetical protein